MPIDPRLPQLFVDDAIIAESVRLGRSVHRPRKYGRVLAADRPWEHGAAQTYGTVVHEDGRFRMWYQTAGRVSPGEQTYFCYAESPDGLNWDKPEVGEHEFAGSTANNIAIAPPPGLRFNSPSLLVDPDDPPRRFKFIAFAASTAPGKPDRGLYAAFSADGLHWEWQPGPVLPGTGDCTTVLYDPLGEHRYVVYTRWPGFQRPLKRRVITRAVSDDFLHWSEPELSLAPDLADGYDLQFYRMSVFPYGQQYIGMVSCLHSLEDKIDVQLVSSRDGLEWDRQVDRGAFLPRGRPGDWDEAWVGTSTNGPIQVGDQMWFFHEGRTAAHGEPVPPFRAAGVGLAVLRQDGFVSLDAGPVEGTLTTKPMVWPGGDLLVNVDCNTVAGPTDRGIGYARVEVLGPRGGSVAGYRARDCVTLTDDYKRGDPNQPVRWRGDRSLNALSGRHVRLRFYLRHARLYAFKASDNRDAESIRPAGVRL